MSGDPLGIIPDCSMDHSSRHPGLPIPLLPCLISLCRVLVPPPLPYLGHGLSGRVATDGTSPLGLAIQLPFRHLDHPVHHLEAGRKGEGGEERTRE